MAKEFVNVRVRNNTGYRATIRLYHDNDAHGRHDGVWENVDPGQTTDAIRAYYETWDVTSDKWAVMVTIPEQGASWVSGGGMVSNWWTDCMLRRDDRNQTFTFDVDLETFRMNIASGGCSCDMQRFNGSSANIYVTNETGETADIELFHENGDLGVTSQIYRDVPAGGRAGPLEARYFVGLGEFALDWWAIKLTIKSGSETGRWISSGGRASSMWKAEQLQSEDGGLDHDFSVSRRSFDIRLKSGSTSSEMTFAGPYHKISHVFVLMLENHSFDNIFAMSGIDGIQAANSSNYNEYNGKQYYVESDAPAKMPSDPPHEFSDVQHQLEKDGDVPNGGFVRSYATSTSDNRTPPKTGLEDVMKCFDTKRQLPVIYTLATEFAICDQWFSSLPGPTWPNRYFVHCASSAGLDRSPHLLETASWIATGLEFPNGSIFDAMRRQEIPYRLYNDQNNIYTDRQSIDPMGSIPQVHSLNNIGAAPSLPVENLARDLKNPYPYKYTFIEPHYGSVTGDFSGGSSQHPMDGTNGGENLIKAVYEAIRNSSMWEESLLIITYDEHGGFYDSVVPGPATPPGDGVNPELNTHGFQFDRYGFRVPAVVVSPWIEKGTVDHTTYDHTSVLKTLEELFSIEPLTQRDRNAHSVLHLTQTLSRARTDCPTQLPDAVPTPPQMDMDSAELDQLKLDRKTQPLPDSGNLIGSLGIALQMRLDLANGSESERQAIEERFKNLRTLGDADDFLAELHQKQEAKLHDESKLRLDAEKQRMRSIEGL